MNDKESREFLQGKMLFTPERMMRYIRFRARLSTNEDIEDILQNALILVTKHFDVSHTDANLELYCMGACNKAIAQNLERYHKVALKKRTNHNKDGQSLKQVIGTSETTFEGKPVQMHTLAPGQSFEESEKQSNQFRTTSLDTFLTKEGSPGADEIFNWDYDLISGSSKAQNPEEEALVSDLIQRVLAELPEEIHRTCFILKYVEGYKREDLILCLKMSAKSIDTVDKRIVRILKAFKDKLDEEERRI